MATTTINKVSADGSITSSTQPNLLEGVAVDAKGNVVAASSVEPSLIGVVPSSITPPSTPQPTRIPTKATQPFDDRPPQNTATDFSGPRQSVPRVSHEVDSNPNESRVFIGAPDYRVFIWGIEVTADVFSVSTTLTLNDRVSTAMVNLVNDNQKYIVPTGWAAADLDVIPDELSGASVAGIEGLLAGLAVPTNTQDPNNPRNPPNTLAFAKQKRANMKLFLAQDAPLPAQFLSKMQNSAIFPLLPGSPLVQMTDPIRIFLKNPWKFAGDEEWYFAFTGYISTVTEDFDAQTNRSIIRLQCEDIRRLLRYMRTSTNPNVFDLNVLSKDTVVITATGALEIQKKVESGGVVASDLTVTSGSAALQAGMKIVNTNPKDRNGVLEFLLFGDFEQVGAKNPGEGAIKAGVLGFADGGKQVFQLPVDNNYEKQLTTQRIDGRSILDELYPTLLPKEVDVFGKDWSLGENAGARPNRVDGANRLFVIFPDPAHFQNLKYPPDWSMRIGFFSEFRSRLDIINEFVQKEDLIWYATPKGDIVVEFPSYDALPQLHNAPWNSIFTLQNEFSRFSYTEDDHEIKTLTLIPTSATDALDTSDTLPFLALGKAVNPELIARYGVREDRENKPFFYDNRTLPGAVDGLTLMRQELKNSEAYRLDALEMLPNYRAPVGRAYLFKFRNLIGFADQISHQCVWGGLAQTVYHFKYLRHFDPGAKDWVKISGNFGWSWKKSSDLGGGSNFVQSQATDTSPIDAEMDNNFQQRINSVADNLTQVQRTRLEALRQQFADPSKSPTDRQAIVSEFNTIVIQAAVNPTPKGPFL